MYAKVYSTTPVGTHFLIRTESEHKNFTFFAHIDNMNDDSTHDVNKEEQEEEVEKEGQEEENEVQQGEYEEESQEENKVQQEALNKTEHDELENLTKFSCINLLNDTYQCSASQSLLGEYFNGIKSKCVDLQSYFSDHLTSIMYEMINN